MCMSVDVRAYQITSAVLSWASGSEQGLAHTYQRHQYCITDTTPCPCLARLVLPGHSRDEPHGLIEHRHVTHACLPNLPRLTEHLL